jgi:hypothetical protein
MYRIVITDFFKKQLKRLVKKNRFLKDDFKMVLLGFRKELAISIGHGVYKIRLCGQNVGKSKGYRVYVFLLEVEEILVPIAIYSKNEKENLTLNELNDFLERTKSYLTLLSSSVT